MDPKNLNAGWTALVSLVVGFGAMVPFMNTGLLVGPVATRLDGADVSFYVGFVVASACTWRCEGVRSQTHCISRARPDVSSGLVDKHLNTVENPVESEEKFLSLIEAGRIVPDLLRPGNPMKSWVILLVDKLAEKSLEGPSGRRAVNVGCRHRLCVGAGRIMGHASLAEGIGANEADYRSRSASRPRVLRRPRTLA